MPKIFVAPGHGQRPDGVFDPGAVAVASGQEYNEHELNIVVAEALAAALRRSGVQVLLEAAGGDHHSDPNYIGSTDAANRWGADYAIEIHHNAGGGTGSEVLVNDTTSIANRHLAERMTAGMAAALGIRARPVIARSREYFNRNTRMPSCIPECCFVDSTRDQAVIGKAGYAARVAEPIAKALCEFLIVTYRPPATPQPQPAPAPASEPVPATAHRGGAMLFYRKPNDPAVFTVNPAGQLVHIPSASMFAELSAALGYDGFAPVIEAPAASPLWGLPVVNPAA